MGRRPHAYLALASLVALLAALAMIASASAADVSPRYIETYTGPAAAYEIDRGGRRLAPHVGMTLQSGDCVVVREPTNKQPGDNANRMTLMVDGAQVQLEAARTKYCVTPAAGVANAAAVAIGRMFASIGDLFQRSQNDFYTEHTAAAQTRGGAQEPALVYLLKADHPRIALGQRALAVAWIGGKMPFGVALFRAGSTTPIASKRDIQARAVHLDPVALTAGKYQLVVRDGSGQAASAMFAAVPSTALPKPSADEAAALRDPSQAADLRATVYAAWLVKQSPDWRFEAYQHVAEFSSTSDLARALSFELTGGA